MWTRIFRHDALSAVFWVFKFSCLLYRDDWLVIKLTDDSGKHDVSMLTVNQPEMILVAVLRGCSITTLRNSVDQPKFPHISDVNSWLAEDSDLKLLWRNWSNLHRSVLSGLSAVRPPIKHNNKTLDTSFLQRKPQACSNSIYRADLPQIFLYRSEIWTLRKGDKNDWHQLRSRFSEESRFHTFWPQRI